MVRGPDGDRVEAAVRLLLAADLSSCGDRELEALTGALGRLRGYVSAFDMAVARRRDEIARAAFEPGAAPAGTSVGFGVDEDAGHPDGTVPPPTPSHGHTPLDLHGFEGGSDRRPGRTSEQDRTRAGVCEVLPMFEAALALGQIDATHVDAIAAAWRDLDDAERLELAASGESLLGHALVESPERFRRRVRDLARRIAHDHGVRVAERRRAASNVRRWTDVRTGMCHLHAELDPETAAAVWTALDERLAVLKGRDDTAGVHLGRLEVDALVELVTASSLLETRSPSLSVLVDLATLRSGLFDVGSICETSDGLALAPEAVRRMACDASILPVVLGGDGVPIDVGRARRLATREQRRALAAMYSTCGFAGCEVRFERCRIHHVDPWQSAGPTDLSNLLPLCSRHHHQVHDGGWTLTMTADRVITLRSPDGTVRFHGESRDRIGADRVDDVVAARAGSSPAGPGGVDAVDVLDGTDLLDGTDILDGTDVLDGNGVPARRAADDRHLADVTRARVSALTRRRCRTSNPTPSASLAAGPRTSGMP